MTYVREILRGAAAVLAAFVVMGALTAAVLSLIGTSVTWPFIAAVLAAALGGSVSAAGSLDTGQLPAIMQGTVGIVPLGVALPGAVVFCVMLLGAAERSVRPLTLRAAGATATAGAFLAAVLTAGEATVRVSLPTGTTGTMREALLVLRPDAASTVVGGSVALIALTGFCALLALLPSQPVMAQTAAPPRWGVPAEKAPAGPHQHVKAEAAAAGPERDGPAQAVSTGPARRVVARVASAGSVRRVLARVALAGAIGPVAVALVVAALVSTQRPEGAGVAVLFGVNAVLAAVLAGSGPSPIALGGPLSPPLQTAAGRHDWLVGGAAGPVAIRLAALAVLVLLCASLLATVRPGPGDSRWRRAGLRGLVAGATLALVLAAMAAAGAGELQLSVAVLRFRVPVLDLHLAAGAAAALLAGAVSGGLAGVLGSVVADAWARFPKAAAGPGPAAAPQPLPSGRQRTSERG